MSASLWSTSVTVIANLVGAGLLSLPYTLQRAGLVTGCVVMCLMACLNASSLLLIARCCELSGKYTYKDVGSAALGSAAATCISAIMAVYTLGSCVSFVVLIGDFLPALVCEDGCDAGPAAFFGQRWVMVTLVGVCCLLPLSLLRDLSSLRFTSALSFVCIAYTSIMIASRAAIGPVVPLSALNLTGGSVGLFISLPITTVAFTLHYNAPRYFYELKDRTLGRFTAVTAISFIVVLVMYQATAIGGYLLFGKDTKGDILSNFSDGDTPALVARIALSCIVISCYPLAFNSLRGSVTGLLPASMQRALLPPEKREGRDNELRSGGGKSGAVVMALDRQIGEHADHSDSGDTPDSERSLLWSDYASSTGLTPSPSSSSHAADLQPLESWIRRAASDVPHFVLTLLLVSLSVGVGLGIPQIAVVLGYKGALGGSLIVFVFPALMYFNLVEQQRASTASVGKGSTATDDDGDVDSSDLKRDDAGGTNSGRRRRLRPSTLFCTSHGLLLVGATVFGLSIMVLGTATTAGLLHT